MKKSSFFPPYRDLLSGEKQGLGEVKVASEQFC